MRHVSFVLFFQGCAQKTVKTEKLSTPLKFRDAVVIQMYHSVQRNVLLSETFSDQLNCKKKHVTFHENVAFKKFFRRLSY